MAGTNGNNDTTDADGDIQMAARSSGGDGGGNQTSKETPITDAKPSYGLQETHTTILPYTGWCSIGLLDHDTPLQLGFRMNSIWDMMVTSLTTLADGGTIAAKAAHIRPVGPGGVNTSGVTFPTTPSAGTQTGERPQWRDYWAQLYQWYTVIGCEYKITVMNTSNTRGANIICGTQYDTYTDTSTSSGNVMPLTTLTETLAFKNIKWKIITSDTTEEDTGSNVSVFSGVYRPGDAKRNIINDGDVKTWTWVDSSGAPTGAATQIPNLKEILTLNFYKAPLNYATAANTCANVQIDLKYLVQFKDLKPQARYPASVHADGLDITQNIANNTTANKDLVRQKLA